jgi:hypothetical protein
VGSVVVQAVGIHKDTVCVGLDVTDRGAKLLSNLAELFELLAEGVRRNWSRSTEEVGRVSGGDDVLRERGSVARDRTLVGQIARDRSLVAQLVSVLAVGRSALREDRSNIAGRWTKERADRCVAAVLGEIVVDRRLEVTAEVVGLGGHGRLVKGRGVGESTSRAVTNAARVAVLERAQTVGAG